jgi:hypothetical protein
MTLGLAFALTGQAFAAVCDGISQASHMPLTTVRVASGLTRPAFVTAPPGDTDRLFLVEQDGTIRILRGGVLVAPAFLDIAAIVRSPADVGGGNEEGLLGLAFAPDYATSGWLFVYYTNLSGNNVVSRYSRDPLNPDVTLPASGQIVLTLNHPTNANHNGGMIAFGPSDGYLYIGTGDGGAACDLSENAQSLASNLGKLLRIDVDPLPYTNPPDNPLVGASGNDEIWSYGLRNPWRWSFDRGNGDLYVGDVGQNQWEEIDYAAAPGVGRGANFGWDNYEGNTCPNASCGNEGSCTLTGYAPPVLVYNHSGAPAPCSTTGGYVYRGCRMPGLGGTYFYADYCAAFIRSFRIAGGVPTDTQNRTAELAPGGGLAINSITSFGEDGRGEVYIVDQGGEVFKIVPVLSNLEVSGIGAQAFLLSRDGDWTWEDLQATSSHPIQVHKVYRSTGNGSGLFDCIRQQLGTTWAGGDPLVPAAGELFSYVVIAENATGTRTSPGTGSGGTPRALSSAPCP